MSSSKTIFARYQDIHTHCNDIQNFYVAGINYKKTEAAVRGQFAISKEQYARILAASSSFGVNQVFLLSTCNRTEIYGIAEDAQQLIDLLCSETLGDKQVFNELAYVKHGLSAIEHVFNVGGGLDSQILGDYEIVGQLKQSVNFARENGFIGSFLERLMNMVLQSSKVIKNQTSLSGGTVSVSFAAVQYIKKHIPDISSKKILLVGVGKIGRVTCKNMVDYLGTRNITLINRTEEKAESLATELGLNSSTLDRLDKELADSDIIIVATNASTPTVLRSHIEDKGKKLIIDLSIPYNVEQGVEYLKGIHVVNVDELSKMKDETIKKRKAEIPKARAIISAHIQEFLEWHEMRKHVPVLKAVKNKLEEINSDAIFFNRFTPSLLPISNSREDIQKIINVMALKMRRQNQRGCHFIEAINDFMSCKIN